MTPEPKFAVGDRVVFVKSYMFKGEDRRGGDHFFEPGSEYVVLDHSEYQAAWERHAGQGHIHVLLTDKDDRPRWVDQKCLHSAGPSQEEEASAIESIMAAMHTKGMT